MRGIYAITNVLTDTVYYGQSINIGERLTKHLWYLNLNKHHNEYLQRSWNKYGKDAFIFTPVSLSEGDLTLLEKKFVQGSYALGLKSFNIADPEQVISASPETRKKISNHHKENPPFRNRKHTAETKIKMSKAQKGSGHPNFGKRNTEEYKKKMSEKLKGKQFRLGQKNSKEHNKNISRSLMGNKRALGFKHTEESKKKISEAIKRRNREQKSI